MEIMVTSMARDYIISNNLAKNSILRGYHLVSNNDRFILLMQSDGNLVGYDRAYTPMQPFWSSATNNSAGFLTKIGSDADVKLSTSGNTLLWRTNTSSTNEPFRLIMQNDRNIVLYDASYTALWHSVTYL
jgi:hypothetical protein